MAVDGSVQSPRRTTWQWRRERGSRLSRAGGLAVLILGLLAAVGSWSLPLAGALAAVSDNYPSPDRSLPDCSNQFGAFSWCAGTPDSSGKYPPNAWYSSRGYGYRNCTDWAS